METKYRAFISYSHADTRWGEWLQRALERYTLPAAFIGLKSDNGVRLERAFGKVFRDRDELTSGADLGTAIRVALAASESLVVICSPASARSRYVEQEIVEFKRLGRGSRIHALIVDGEPHASARAGQEALECLPRALRFALDERGELSDMPDTEVLAPDARSGKDGKQRAQLKLIAGLLAIDFDALYQRERRRRRQNALALLGVVLAVLGAVTGLGLYGASRDAEAKRQQQAVRHGAYAAALELSEIQRTSGNVGKAVRTLANQIQAPPEAASAPSAAASAADLREFAWRVLWKQYDGHRHAIQVAGEPEGLDLSPDGQTLAIADDSSLLTLWDVQTGRQVAELEDDKVRITRPRFVAGGSKLALVVTKDRDERLHLRPVGALQAEGEVFDVRFVVAFGPAQRKLLVQDASGWKVIDAVDRTTTVLQTPRDRTGIDILGHSPDDATVAFALSRVEVGVYDGDSGRERWRLRHPAGWQIQDLRIAPGGVLLAACVDSESLHQVVVWDLATGRERMRLRGHEADRSQYRAMAASRDGRLVALLTGQSGVSPRQQNRLAVWDAASGQRLFALEEAATGYVTSMAFAPERDLLATGSRDHQVRLWDARSGGLQAVLGVHHGEVARDADAQRLHRRKNSLFESRSRLGAGVSRVLYAPDGRTLVSASAELGTVRLWDVGGAWAAPTQFEQPDRWSLAAFSPDATLLAAGDREGGVALWDLASGALQARRDAESASAWPAVPPAAAGASARRDAPAAPARRDVQQLAFAPDGSRLAVAHGDGRLRLLQAPGLQELARWSAVPGATRALAFDGAELVQAVARDGKDGSEVVVSSWVPGRAAPVHQQRRRAAAFALAPGGRRLASVEAAPGHGGGCTLVLSDRRSGASTSSPLGIPVSCFGATFEGLAWAADGRRLAVAYQADYRAPKQDRADLVGLKIFDVAPGGTLRERARPVVTPRFALGEVSGMSFSPDGRRLAVAADLRDADGGRPFSRPAVALLDLDASPMQRSDLPVKGCAGTRFAGCVTWGGFSADGRMFAVLAGHERSYNGTPELLLWRIGQDAPARLALQERAHSLHFAPRGHEAALILSSLHPGQPVVVVDASAAPTFRTLGRYDGKIVAFGLPASGVPLVEVARAPISGGIESELRPWGAAAPIATQVHPQREWLRAMDIAADGSTYAQRAPDGTVTVHRVGGGTAVMLEERVPEDEVPTTYSGVRPSPLQLSPDGRWLATIGKDTTRLWDTRSGRLVHRLAGTAPLAFSGDGRRLATQIGCKAVTVWQVDSGARVAQVDPEVGCANALALDPAGRRLLVLRVTSEGAEGLFGATSARIWAVDDTGRLPVDLLGYAHDGQALAAFLLDGTTLATAGPEDSVQLWDPVTGRRLLTLKALPGRAAGLAFTRDGRTLWLAQERSMVRWDGVGRAGP